MTFGASSDLSTQITQGAPVDVFASASPKNMNTVGQPGLRDRPGHFASNTLEIAVPPSNPGKVTVAARPAAKGVKVAVCAPAVPCGVVAAKVFDNAKITVKPVASEADVKSTLAVVESGEVDAGLVYVTDVRAAGGKVKGIAIPGSVNASTEYPIAALKDAKNPALAKAFVDYWSTPPRASRCWPRTASSTRDRDPDPRAPRRGSGDAGAGRAAGADRRAVPAAADARAGRAHAVERPRARSTATSTSGRRCALSIESSLEATAVALRARACRWPGCWPGCGCPGWASCARS